MKNRGIISLIVGSMLFINMSINVLGLEINNEKNNLYNFSEVEYSKNNIDSAKRAAKNIIKEQLEIELNEPNKIEFVSYMDGNTKSYKWELTWNISKSEKNEDINISIDAINGRILNLSHYEYFNETNQVTNKITKEKCRKNADEFFIKINPKGFEETEFLIDTYTVGKGKYVNQNLNFKYIRKVNDIKFQDNYVNIEVNALTGNIVSYSCVWTSDLEFPSDSNIIGNNRAMEIFQDSIKLDKTYIFEKNKEGIATKNLKLVYMSNYNSDYNVHIRTGEKIDYNNNKIPEIKVKDISKNKLENLMKSLNLLPYNTFPVNENRARIVINSYLKEIYGANYDVDKIKYSDVTNSNEYVKKMWVGEFIEKKDNNNEYKSKGIIAIDPYTEGLIYCEKNDYLNESDKIEINFKWDELYDKAIEIIGKYFPDKLDKIKTEQYYIESKDKEKQRYTNFSFSRKINGIEFLDNCIKVSFDLKTGNIVSIQSKWSENISVLKNEDIVTDDEAKRIYFDNNRVEPIYYIYNTVNDSKNDRIKVDLAYALKSVKVQDVKYIDAATGKILNADGIEIDNSNEEFMEKIKGNKYENELSILAQEGIIDSKNFRLYKDITMLDLIKMLMNAKGYKSDMFNDMEKLKFINIYGNNPNYKYIQLAVQYGMIENKEVILDLNEKVSREKMAEYIVKFMEYDKLAENKSIFNLKVKDINEVEEIGYVAIAKGLGILSVENEKIRPKENITMVEACVGIYNILDDIRVNDKKVIKKVDK